MWNVTIACGMLLIKFNVRDAACSLRSHWLALVARTYLLVAGGWWLVVGAFRRCSYVFVDFQLAAKMYQFPVLGFLIPVTDRWKVLSHSDWHQ